jgi:hypothetical protein
MFVPVKSFSESYSIPLIENVENVSNCFNNRHSLSERH